MAITLRLVKGSELTYAEGDANFTTLQAADALALPKAGGSLTGALNEAPTVTVASSATPAIFAAAGNSISLTGTTTVVGFDTIAAGAVRRVVFAGVLQLTNGANLINISGANIVTAAGDVAMFLSQGAGVTLMVSYTRASGAALVGSGGVPNQTGALAASATAAPVADTVIGALATKATVGVVTYVDVTASRALLATDIGKVLRNTTAGSLTITLAAVGVAGNVFATKHSGAGTLLVVTGGGVTAVDTLGLAAAQATDAGAVLWEFDTATRVLAS